MLGRNLAVQNVKWENRPKMPTTVFPLLDHYSFTFSLEPMPPSNKVYPSAFDRWLMILIYSPPIIMLLIGIYCAFTQLADEGIIFLSMGLATTLLNLLVTYPCRYTLTPDSLNIRCGFIHQSIPLESIIGAELSSSWQSGPALSLRRVRVRFDKGQRLVSPVNREQFIADLLAAVESIRRTRAHAEAASE